MIEIIGVIGSFLLSVCTFPQTIKCIMQGHAVGISSLSLLITLVGSICILSYMISQNVGIIIMANIIILIVTMLIQLKYSWWPRNKENLDGNK